MKTTEPIRNKNHVRQLIEYYLKLGQIRNYVLIALGVYTALRISDILSLKCDDVFDFKNRKVRKSITLTEKKTGKSKIVALNKNLVAALKAYFPEAKPGAPLIINSRTGKAISRIQAYRIIRAAAEALGFGYAVSCHSLRKTFGYHCWKDGVSPAVIMEIYNHSSLSVTKRYLGVSQDDVNKAYNGLNFSA
jgi:integrase